MSLKKTLLLILLAAFPACSFSAAEWDVSLDDFAGNTPLKSWTFSNGHEFPGASGNLVVVEGSKGSKAAKLTYSMSCDAANKCGHYVAAYWEAPAPIVVPAGSGVSFWVNADRNTDIALRFVDGADQTFQYRVSLLSLEDQKLEGWRKVNASFSANPEGHWGGKNDGVFSGSIKRFGILAEPRIPGAAQGALLFGDVHFQLMNHSVSLAHSLTMPVVPGSSPAENLSAILGVNIHFTDKPALLALTHETGFTFVRMDLHWDAVEKKPGQYNFTAYDTLMREAEAQGLGVLWLFTYGNALHGGYPLTEASIQAYAGYAKAAAAHYKGHNVKFEIWNEPEGKSWHIPPDIFVRLVHATSQAIRSVWPQAVVVSGGTSGGVNAQMTYSSLIAKSGSAIDAIAIHPYRQSAPETMIGDVNMIRSVIPSSTMLWDSEWGYPSAGYFSSAVYGDGHSAMARHRQAVLAVRELLSAWLAKFPLAVWYDLIDDGTDPNNNEHNFGLLAHDMQPKPAYIAVKYLTQVTEKRKATGLLSGLPSGLHALLLDAAGVSPVLIVWSDMAGAQYDVSFPASDVTRVTDMYGNAIAAKNAAPLSVREDLGPVYVYLR